MNYFQEYERERKFKPGSIWVAKRPDNWAIKKLIISGDKYSFPYPIPEEFVEYKILEPIFFKFGESFCCSHKIYVEFHYLPISLN